MLEYFDGLFGAFTQCAQTNEDAIYVIIGDGFGRETGFSKMQYGTHNEHNLCSQSILLTLQENSVFCSGKLDNVS